MKKNMGTTDKLIRTMVAVLIAILYLTNVISGITAIVLGSIALVMLVTSMIGFCPLYSPFGISTLKNKSRA